MRLGWFVGGGSIVLGLLLTYLGLIVFEGVRAIPTEYQEQKRDVERIISNNEIQEAYALFKDRYASIDQAAQHQAAHLFGEALYEKGGLDLFSICDQSFGFGCYHSFISLALKDRGESVAQELDAKCVAAYGVQGLGCSHGIGHGLLSYFGYDLGGLGKALTLCESLSWKHPYGGCRDGVFMEYDFQTMAQGEGGSIRPVDPNTPLMPCTEVNTGSRVACFFGLPALWIASNVASIDGMASWCQAITSVTERAACYRGIGYGNAPVVSFSVPEIAMVCDQIPSVEGRLQCREGGAWMLYADPALRDTAEGLCTIGLTEAQTARCLDEYLFVIE